MINSPQPKADGESEQIKNSVIEPKGLADATADILPEIYDWCIELGIELTHEQAVWLTQKVAAHDQARDAQNKQPDSPAGEEGK